MTRKEYVELLEGSEVFKSLDPDFQERILKAKGEDRKRYEDIYTTERDAILEAQKELMEKNIEIVKKFETDSKKSKKDFFKKSEERERLSDENEAEELLKSIK